MTSESSYYTMMQIMWRQRRFCQQIILLFHLW